MKLALKVLSGFLLLVILVITFAFLKFTRLAGAHFAPPQFSISEDVAKADAELGKRIYNVRSGCIECHGENLAGAKVIENGAMGTIFGANITPFKLKDWSDEQIAAAVRYGLHKSGRSLQFMPSFDYQEMSRSDLAALIAYMRSVPEVAQESHENTFGPMARVLAGFGQMPVMFPAFHVDFDKGFADKPEEGPTPEFGRYLAQSCTGCHGAEFRGGKIPGGDPAWPAASNIRLGSGWDEAKFRSVIATGVSPVTGQALRPPMPVALLKQLNDMEVTALWAFLSTLN